MRNDANMRDGGAGLLGRSGKRPSTLIDESAHEGALGVAELAPMMFATPFEYATPGPYRMTRVCGVSAPLKILDAVVVLIAILVMHNRQPLRVGDKCQSNEAMHEQALGLVVEADGCMQVSVIDRNQAQNAPASSVFIGPEASGIADLICRMNAGDGFPDHGVSRYANTKTINPNPRSCL